MRKGLIQQLSAPGGGEPLQPVSVAQEAGGTIVDGCVISPEQGLFAIREGILDLLPRGPGPLNLAQRSNLLPLTALGYERPWRVNSLTLMSGKPLGFDRERALFDEMIPAPVDGLWFDIGASTALYARWLAPRARAEGGDVVAIDYSMAMLRVARARAIEEGQPEIGFVRARAERLPVATDSLSGATCGGTLNEMGRDNVPLVLRELSRALRPGGLLFIMHLLRARERPGRPLQQALSLGSGITFWSRRESNRLFERAGFRVESSQDIGVVAFTRLRLPS